MADPELLDAEGEEVLREEINRRIGGVFVAGCVSNHSYIAGTGIELEVLFDAKVHGGRLDWRDVLPKIHGQGPLLVLARTDEGYGVLAILSIVSSSSFMS
jgi:hypothetical protein